MNQLRSELGITAWGDYFGLGETPDREYHLLLKLIDDFGSEVYPQSTNIVVLAAHPGSIALTQYHPLLDKSIAPEVGYLAARLTRVISIAFARGELTTWGTRLEGLADTENEGQFIPRATISWSDFSAFSDIPLLVTAADW